MSKRTRRNKERLDRNVVALVKTLNSFEGVRAIGSCGGHPEPRKPRQWPLGSWYVKLILSHDEHGWRALEFLAWLVLDIGRAGRRVILYPSAPPPHMNDPGKVLSFVLEGRSGEDPEEMARLIAETKTEFYVPPTGEVLRFRGESSWAFPSSAKHGEGPQHLCVVQSE